MSNYRPENLLGTTKNTTDSSLWKERYLPDLQLAGDGALSSIDKGLSYARDFMADANPGTDPDKIRTAAVKWALATDTNDEALKKQADFELMDSLAPGSVGTNAIGTPSLSEYIRKKDEYDYKTGRYTTTANASKTPTAQTRELQTLLNRGGYTDRFGNALKEDGILGAKTLYAANQADEAEPSVTAMQAKTADTLKQRDNYSYTDKVALTSGGGWSTKAKEFAGRDKKIWFLSCYECRMVVRKIKKTSRRVCDCEWLLHRRKGISGARRRILV